MENGYRTGNVRGDRKSDVHLVRRSEQHLHEKIFYHWTVWIVRSGDKKDEKERK
jgi:hypothetical protein